MASRLWTVVIVCLFAAPTFAQTPPAEPVATGRCTGVFCDLYYSGKPAPAPPLPGQPALPEPPDPTHLPCHDFLCAAFGGRTPDAPPPAIEPVVTPEPIKTAKRKHKTKIAASPEASKSEAVKPDAAK